MQVSVVTALAAVVLVICLVGMVAMQISSGRLFWILVGEVNRHLPPQEQITSLTLGTPLLFLRIHSVHCQHYPVSALRHRMYRRICFAVIAWVIAMVALLIIARDLPH
jgi:hypothetical protein